MSRNTKKLSDQEKRDRHRASMRKYYAANKKRFQRYYKLNKTERDAHDKLHRDLNRDAYLLKQRIYNNTKRSKK